MRILVLGGAGFIGANIVRRLLATWPEAHVIVVDNLWTGRWHNLPGTSRITRVERGVEDAGPVVGSGYDLVVHLASPASPCWYMPEPIRTVAANVMGGILATRAVAPGGTILFTSTSEVYGDPRVSPQPESYLGSVSCTGPRAAYDEGKRATEALLMNWWRLRGRDEGTRLKIARIFNCYGPHTRADDGRAVSNFLTAAMRGQPLVVYGTGKQTRCFGHVDDIVEGLLQLTLRTPDNFAGPLNIGLDEEISVVRLAQYVADELFGGRVPITHGPPAPDDPQQRRPDLTLCRATLPDWRPSIDWRTGVRHTLEWFQKTGV